MGLLMRELDWSPESPMRRTPRTVTPPCIRLVCPPKAWGQEHFAPSSRTNREFTWGKGGPGDPSMQPTREPLGVYDPLEGHCP